MNDKDRLRKAEENYEKMYSQALGSERRLAETVKERDGALARIKELEGNVKTSETRTTQKFSGPQTAEPFFCFRARGGYWVMESARPLQRDCLAWVEQNIEGKGDTPRKRHRWIREHVGQVCKVRLVEIVGEFGGKIGI